jgi:pimeloyl-ACP methyl ester carboxylesterase
MAEDVVTLLDELHIQEPAIMAGLSMGGYVAFEFWRQFPHRVHALGLWSTRAAADAPQQREGRMKLLEQLHAKR